MIVPVACTVRYVLVDCKLLVVVWEQLQRPYGLTHEPKFVLSRGGRNKSYRILNRPFLHVLLIIVLFTRLTVYTL